uniref:NADH dehydrogenase [ubiquinone] 1 alpha subcomplex subunit 2 n=1 Tax=Centropages tenuiremis TaxID=544689 RepID=A0A0U2V7N8_9MAXI|nr:NADH dehydrogenase [Centropages tenuiremis]
MAAAKQAIKLGPGLREIRLHLCQKSGASQGVRDFVEKHYVPLKQNNPKFPFLIRECSGIHPKLWARYGFGRETSVDLSGKSADDVYMEIAKLES